MSSRKEKRSSSVGKGMTFVGAMVVAYFVFRWFKSKKDPELADDRKAEEETWEDKLTSRERKNLETIRSEIRQFANTYKDTEVTECTLTALKRKYDILRTPAMPENALISELTTAVSNWWFSKKLALKSMANDLESRGFVCQTHGLECP